MAKKRGEGVLVRAGELLPGLESFVPVIRQIEEAKTASPQRRHHFTREKQIEALLKLGQDATPDMGFMNRLLALCSLPRTDPGDQLQYKRENGPYKLIMIAGGDTKLPYGNLPRLLLAWICTEVVQKKERKIVLGSSLAEFMHKLGINNDSGGAQSDRTRLKTQIDRLFSCQIQLIVETDERKRMRPYPISDDSDLWWSYREPNQLALMKSWIEIGQKLYDEILAHPVPIDMNILKQMKRSSLGIDLYLWLSYKVHAMTSQGKGAETLTWERLYVQFGADPSKVSDKFIVNNFRRDALRELKKLRLSWPTLRFETPTGALKLHPGRASITPKAG
jgi:hypothetical protein